MWLYLEPRGLTIPICDLTLDMRGVRGGSRGECARVSTGGKTGMDGDSTSKFVTCKIRVDATHRLMYRADQVRSSFDFVSLSRCAERARAAGLLPHRSESQIPMPKREKRSKADAGSTVELSASLKIDADDESATSGNDRCDFNTESWGHRCRTSVMTPMFRVLLHTSAR